jgi:soluble lytic murein transglycosylase-like protein
MGGLLSLALAVASVLPLPPGLAQAAQAATDTAASTSPGVPSYFDAQIRRASARYLPWEWTWLKAQLYAESRLDPSAVSPAGARGIAQLMPATHREIARALRAGMVSPDDAEYAIEAAAYYMARMRAVWKADRPEPERRRFAQASYNAGAGNILAAQRRCLASESGCRAWGEVAPYLIRVTGSRNSAETLGYVARIERVHARLVAAL